MSNRAQRRADTADMRREMGHTYLNTFLTAADAKLDHQPLLAQARTWWRANIAARKPMCIACKQPFTDSAEVGSPR